MEKGQITGEEEWGLEILEIRFRSRFFPTVYFRKKMDRKRFVVVSGEHQSIASKIDKELLKFRGQSSLFSQVHPPCTLIKIS